MPDPSPSPDAGFLTLEAAASRHGALCWAERRLYQVAGARAATPALPAAVRVHLFEAATRHAWHAELWAGRLPVLAGWDPGSLAVPPGPAADAVLDALGALDGAAALLAGLYTVVVPELLDACRRHGADLTEVAGGPASRVLRVVLSGTEEEIAAGRALLEAVPASGAGTADDAVASLLALAGPGGGAGKLFPW